MRSTRTPLSGLAPLALASAILALPQATHAEGTNPVVVELFTSQGCASCPPADDLLAEMAENPAILPLALHVDYWDYLGWQDHMAHPDFTRRQKAYAHAAGEKMVYTPQAIVAGQARMVGSDAQGLMAAVMAAMQSAPQVTLALSPAGEGRATIRAESAADLAAPVEVALVRYLPEKVVEIGHGENAGLTMRYVNIVTAWIPLGQWDGAAPLALDVDLPGDDAAAVILQQGGPGAVIAAARLP